MLCQGAERLKLPQNQVTDKLRSCGLCRSRQDRLAASDATTTARTLAAPATLMATEPSLSYPRRGSDRSRIGSCKVCLPRQQNRREWSPFLSALEADV